MLCQDGREVGFGDIVGESTVAEDARDFPGRRELLMPFDDTLRQRLHVASVDSIGETDKQDTAADRVNFFPRDRTRLDRDAKIKPELQ
jgi:hypothetical protein